MYLPPLVVFVDASQTSLASRIAYHALLFLMQRQKDERTEKRRKRKYSMLICCYVFSSDGGRDAASGVAFISPHRPNYGHWTNRPNVSHA